MLRFLPVLDTLEADPTTATAVATVQADVDQNEADADAAIAAVQADVDQNESDATQLLLAETAEVLLQTPHCKATSTQKPPHAVQLHKLTSTIKTNPTQMPLWH